MCRNLVIYLYASLRKSCRTGFTKTLIIVDEIANKCYYGNV